MAQVEPSLHLGRDSIDCECRGTGTDQCHSPGRVWQTLDGPVSRLSSWHHAVSVSIHLQNVYNCAIHF